MNETANSFWTPRRTANLADEAISVLAGATLTAGLFLALSHFEYGGGSARPSTLEDLRTYTAPVDLPPPPPEQQPETVAEGAPFAGIDIEASESPVRIAVTLPVLDPIPIPVAPPAKIVSTPPTAEFRPKPDISPDVHHVYQQNEVDQHPSTLVSAHPIVPPNVRQHAQYLRVTLIFVVNANGAATDIRIVTSSGNPTFDRIMADCVRDEWLFTPAIKKSHKVRCLVQKSFTLRWTTTPFDS
jgi:TonB family protein